MDSLLSESDKDDRARRGTAKFGDRGQQDEFAEQLLNDFEEVNSKGRNSDDSDSDEDQDKVDLENTDEDE